MAARKQPALSKRVELYEQLLETIMSYEYAKTLKLKPTTRKKG